MFLQKATLRTQVHQDENRQRKKNLLECIENCFAIYTPFIALRQLFSEQLTE